MIEILMLKPGAMSPGFFFAKKAEIGPAIMTEPISVVR